MSTFSASVSADELRRQLDFVIDLARRAGAVAMEHYGSVERLTKTHQATTDEAVTVADRACQKLIVSALRERFPGDGIIGEESETGTDITADIRDPNGRTWVIDPIDGTNNFIAGMSQWCVCIGLLDGGNPVLGVVYDVVHDRMYAGAAGLGASVNGQPTHVKEVPMSSASVVLMTSNLLSPDGRCPDWACQLIGQTHWKVRVLGSAALEAAQVGAGIAHAAVTVNGKLWDCVAPAAVVLAAGGRILTLQGKNVFPYDIKGYRGAKVPYLSAAPNAAQPMLDLILQNP